MRIAETWHLSWLKLYQLWSNKMINEKELREGEHAVLAETLERKEVEDKTQEKTQILERRYYYPPFYEGVVIDPGFFKLERYGRIIFALGTLHCFPLKILPEAYLKIIGTCEQAFFENTTQSTYTEADLVKIGLLRDKPNPDWNKGFTSAVEEIFKNAFQIWCKNSGRTVPIERVNPKMAFWFCHGVSSINNMDQELEKLFGDKVDSLDTQSSLTTVITEFSIEETNRRLEIQFGYLRDSPCYESEFLEYDKQYLSGKMLYDEELIRVQEEDLNMVSNRNKVWFSKLNEANFKDPTFVGVGFGHLVGRAGLLCLMENAGWKISKINREGKEEPISAAKLFSSHQPISKIPKLILNGFKNFVIDHPIKFGLGTLGVITALAVGRTYLKINRIP